MRFPPAGLGLCALALLAACDVPTAAPKWDTKWDVPSKSTTISVATLLPSGVSVTGNNAAFEVAVAPANITNVLGADCPLCQAGNGSSMIKPQFQSIGSSSASIPAKVVSAASIHDTLVVTINNGYNFDPIRPSATQRGWLTIKAVSGGVLIAQDSLDGTATALPAGAIVVRRLPVTGSVSGTTGIVVSTKLVSPPSDTAISMDASRTLGFVAAVTSFLASTADVTVSDQSVSASATTLDLTSISSGITDRLNSGSLVMNVTNPFSVAGTLSVKLTGPGVNIAKPFKLDGQGNTVASKIDFTTEELKSLFGKLVNLTIDGSVSQTTTSVPVQPNQTVTIGTRLIVDVNAGSTK
ncbi:MAG TPA: hypothetical protein VF159_11485 [Gemmatimonadaceae bacterium]